MVIPVTTFLVGHEIIEKCWQDKRLSNVLKLKCTFNFFVTLFIYEIPNGCIVELVTLYS